MKLYQFNNFNKTSSVRSPLTLLAVALLSLSIHSAKAASVPNPSEGDLFLSFRADSEPGAQTSYLVKIGQDTVFKSVATGASVIVSNLGSINSDLQFLYGNDWSIRGDLHWSVIGTRTSLNPVVYGSRRRVSSQLPSTPWPTLSLTARAATSSAISSVVNGIRGYRGSDAAPGSSAATIQSPDGFRFSRYISQSDTLSKNGNESVVSTAGTSQFGSLSRWDYKNGNLEGDFGSGTAGTLLDLYEIGSSVVTRLGTFSISSLGTLTYTVISEIPGNRDTDGDGVTDLAEIKVGTSITNRNDYLQVGSFARTASGPRVTAVTVAGKSYHLEYSQDLTTWLPIAYHLAGAGAAPLDYTDTDTVRRSRAKGFYRLRIVP